jgi:hypothetical protein
MKAHKLNPSQESHRWQKLSVLTYKRELSKKARTGFMKLNLLHSWIKQTLADLDRQLDFLENCRR